MDSGTKMKHATIDKLTRFLFLLLDAILFVEKVKPRTQERMRMNEDRCVITILILKT